MNHTIKEVAERITGRNLNTGDGINIKVIERTESRLGYSLPLVLKDFYLLVGNMGMFMSSFEYFIPPDKLDISDEKLVFLEENQGVCFWAVNRDDPDPENPVVYVCADIGGDRPEWYSEEVRLAEFLEIIMYFQCAEGGYEFGCAVYEHNYDDKEEYIQFLNHTVTGWERVVRHNGLVIYQKDDRLVWYFTDNDGNPGDMIFASVRTRKSMRQMQLMGFLEL